MISVQGRGHLCRERYSIAPSVVPSDYSPPLKSEISKQPDEPPGPKSDTSVSKYSKNDLQKIHLSYHRIRGAAEKAEGLFPRRILRKVSHELLQLLSAIWRLLCYCWSHGAYPDSFCHVFFLESDQFPLVAVQAEIWRRHPCPGYVGWVQGVPPLKPEWLSSFCGYILRKDQKGLPVSARGSLWLGSTSGLPASGPPRVLSRHHFEQKYHDPIFPGRPKAFRPGPVGCPRQGLRLLERGRQESCQCRGKSVAAILPQHPQHRLKVSLEEQAR